MDTDLTAEQQAAANAETEAELATDDHAAVIREALLYRSDLHAREGIAALDALQDTLTRYRNALERIASGPSLRAPHDIARAALDGPKETGPATADTVSAPATQAAAGASPLDGPKEESE